jgi:hypothetical protein
LESHNKKDKGKVFGWKIDGNAAFKSIMTPFFTLLLFSYFWYTPNINPAGILEQYLGARN